MVTVEGNLLVNFCIEVLGDFNSKSFNFFENLVDIHKAWENSNSKDFPPQLPFISLFIIAATKMGEDAEKIDYRAFYSQLYKVMQLPSKISNIKLQNNFRHTFGSKTTEDEREELFNKFSIWIDENSQFGVNTFINNNPSEHRYTILDQFLMNTKDRNTLPRFFKDKGFEPGNQNYLEKQLFNTFKKYLFNEYKARRFSPALRNNVLNDDLEENLKIRISQTIKDIHENWDGTILDPKGNKSIEILYVIEKNEREGNLEFKLFFDDIDKYFDVEKITFEDKFNKELIFEEDLFLASKYFCDEHNNFQFNQNIWKAKGIDLKARFVSYEKTVRLFKYEEFEVEEYIEVGKYESIKNSEEYIAVFPKSVAEDLTNWLENNPNIQFNKENVSSYGEICLIEEIKLINSIPYKVEKPFMEVFVPKSVLTDKIELIGGLTTGAKTYLSRELPTIFIPESYREDEDLQLTINGKSFELKDYIEPHEYVKDSTTKQYSIELNKDDIKIDFFVEFDTTQLISHLAGSIGMISIFH